jgi:hypothetical protein
MGSWRYRCCVEKWDVRAARRRVALLVLVPVIVALIVALVIFEAMQPGNWF